MAQLKNLKQAANDPGDGAVIQHKVLITGTGRAGTTFLVQLLTSLGLDTGFGMREARDVDAASNAGLERGMFRLAPPGKRSNGMWELEPAYIIKNPLASEQIDQMVVRDDLILDHVYVPMRDLEDAVTSRLRNGTGDGGLFAGCNNAEEMRAQLLKMFYQLTESLVRNNIPHTLLHFPAFACDANYCYEKLAFLLKGVSFSEFQQHFQAVSQTDKINVSARSA